MGRWIAEECGKIVDETSAFLGRANSDEDAKNLCSDHHADCDAYEARIAKLEADIASAIKMAKVAIKYLPACDYITDIDGIESISTITTLLCHALAGGNCDEEE